MHKMKNLNKKILDTYSEMAVFFIRQQTMSFKFALERETNAINDT